MYKDILYKIIKNRYNGNPDDILNKVIPNYMLDVIQVPDLAKASKLIDKHIKLGSMIGLSVDIDADGIDSGGVLLHGLLRIGAKRDNLKLIIGARKEGRGVNNFVVNKIEEIQNKTNRKFGLIITADHGSTDEVRYKYLKDKISNLDIIVTDHHTVEYDNYPTSADAFINPQRTDCESLKYLCGCAVAYLLLLRYLYDITKDMDNKEAYVSKYAFTYYNKILPYLAIATVADVMPLDTLFNRALVNEGLKYLNSNASDKLPVWNNIREVLNLPNDIYSRDINLYIGAFVNTGNRLGIESLALLAMVTDNQDYSLPALTKLQEKNKERKCITAIATREVNESIRKEVLNRKYSLVGIVDSYAMVNGIIAGNLGSTYSRPCICFGNTPKDGKLIGSGRSGIEELNLLDILNTINTKYPEIGCDAHGHKTACGCVINADKLDMFKEMFDIVSGDRISKLTFKEIEPDYYLEPKYITISLASKIRNIGPYGLKFIQPIFVTDNVIVKKIKPNNYGGYVIVLDMDGVEFKTNYYFRGRTKHNLNEMNILDIIRANVKIKLYYNIEIMYVRDRNNVNLNIVDMIIV